MSLIYRVRRTYAVCLSPVDEFAQVSFVNGINTSKGGKHVEYLVNQITKKMIEYIKKKKKITVRATTIKEQLMIFWNTRSGWRSRRPGTRRRR